jgi:hypothetical protein
MMRTMALDAQAHEVIHIIHEVGACTPRDDVMDLLRWCSAMLAKWMMLYPTVPQARPVIAAQAVMLHDLRAGEPCAAVKTANHRR